jgi:hypothetical protein
MGKNQDPGFGLNIYDPSHCLSGYIKPVLQHIFVHLGSAFLRQALLRVAGAGGFPRGPSREGNV